MSERIPVRLYANSTCIKNGTESSSGGWCAILRYGTSHEKTLKGFESSTTQNKMALRAIIEGVKALSKPCEVTVIVNSRYIVDTSGSMKDFKSRGWKTKAGVQMANLDLWQELIAAGKEGGHHMNFQIVEENPGLGYIDRCSHVARSEVERA